MDNNMKQAKLLKESELKDARALLSNEIARVNSLNAQASASSSLSLSEKAAINTIVKSIFDPSISAKKANRNLNNMLKKHK